MCLHNSPQHVHSSEGGIHLIPNHVYSHFVLFWGFFAEVHRKHHLIKRQTSTRLYQQSSRFLSVQTGRNVSYGRATLIPSQKEDKPTFLLTAALWFQGASHFALKLLGTWIVHTFFTSERACLRLKPVRACRARIRAEQGWCWGRSNGTGDVKEPLFFFFTARVVTFCCRSSAFFCPRFSQSRTNTDCGLVVLNGVFFLICCFVFRF